MWTLKRFNELTTQQLFAVMRLRVDVFVVEQRCAYAELDDYDISEETLHLLGMRDDTLVAYARVMTNSAVSSRPTAIRIGRVVVRAECRRSQLGRSLMSYLIAHLEHQYPKRDIEIAAQTSVQNFYASLGFKPVSAAYLEDDIEHIDMRLSVVSS